MPKRRNKGSKKRRNNRSKPRQPLPRPSRGGDGEQQPTDAAETTTPAPTTDNLDSRPPARRVTGALLATIRDLFVRLIDRYARYRSLFAQLINHRAWSLRWSLIRRLNTPAYAEALAARSVGDLISGVVVVVQLNGGLLLDVDGAIGSVSPDELVLADSQSAQERYPVGDTVNDLFVWLVDHDARAWGLSMPLLALSVRRNAPGYVQALDAHNVGDLVSGVVTGFQRNGGLWLDVDGIIGSVSPNELVLADGQSAQERYPVGDTVNDLFVWQVNHDARELHLSVRRSAPANIEALATHSVGDLVSGVVTGFQGHGGLWLDVDGIIGSVSPRELALADGQSAQERYPVGDTVNDLFVWQVNHDARDLYLSVRRSAPGYVEALAAHSVGEVVSGVVTDFQGHGGLWLDVDGIIGSVSPWELPLADGESVQDRYPIGEPVRDLFVWQVNHDARHLSLSVRRSAPGYVEALAAHSVGEVVSGVVTDFQGHGGLWLDVDGIIGSVSPWELPLADGESVQDRYPIGEPVRDLFVWQVNHKARDLTLSVRRSAPAYVEALDARSVGEIVSGVVTRPNEWGIWLDAAGVVGWIPTRELALDEGESPRDGYPVDQPIEARVWQIDRISRTTILSVRRLGTAFNQESIAPGAAIYAVVRGTTPPGDRSSIRVLAADNDVRIPPHALSLSTAVPPPFNDGEVIRVVVIDHDERGRPTELSHRRALDRWEAEVERLTPGTLVAQARVLPLAAHPGAGDQLAVDLGAITGLIANTEIDRETAEELMTYGANELYPVIVESIDRNVGIATVSHDKYTARWQELAADLQEGEEIDPELRDVDGNSAFLDLGSGLLAEMPIDQLPSSETTGATAHDRIGENIPARIAHINHDTQTIYAEKREHWLEALIGKPESETLEFKAVLIGRGGHAARTTMTRRSIRTVNAFVNTDGGRLVVGVHDETREVVGAGSRSRLGRGPIDKKIDNAFRALVSNLKQFAARSPLESADGLVTWRAVEVRGKTLLVVDCKRGPDHGVDLVVGQEKTEFYIRDHDSTRRIRDSDDINAHLRKRAERAARPTDP